MIVGDNENDDAFSRIIRPQVGKRGINNKRYNMVNATAVVGVAQYQQQVTPSPQFEVQPFQDYLLTGLYKSLTQKNRAGAVSSITDARINLFGINRLTIPDNIDPNSDLLQLQFYDSPYIPLRLPLLRNFNAQIFALQEGNFVVADIVDVTIIFEFEYIGF